MFALCWLALTPRDQKDEESKMKIESVGEPKFDFNWFQLISIMDFRGFPGGVGARIRFLAPNYVGGSIRR